jgi:farnesyl-diphosphate farnesyltransferase
MAVAQPAFPYDLLRANSRSFYLTLRVLPAPVRPQIGLAYLLARTTDTIADTEILPVGERLASLQRLRERILNQSSAPLNFTDLAKQQASPSEAVLLERVETSLAALQHFPAADQKLIRDVLDVITGGQILDLRRFGSAVSTPVQKIISLETGSELDDYTYRVAGCVGEFWTKICRAHLFPDVRLNEKQLIDDGIRFGKGLQLVNILRDLPVDLKNGRCYLPRQRLDEAKLLPEVLLSPVNEEKFRAVYTEYLDKASAHLAAGWRYTNALPFGQFRVRLACAWPILIGVRTIEKLRAAGVVQLQQRVKVSRGEVRSMIFRSLLASPFPAVWRRLSPFPPVKAVASGRELA